MMKSVESLNRIKQNAKLLHSQATIADALAQLANDITADYQTLNPIALVVMNGGLIFAGQLLPHLKFPLQIDYCHATRYRGAMHGGEIEWLAKPQMSLQDRHVLLIDDILDEGHTLKAIANECEALGASSVKTVVLIEKLHQRKAIANMKPDYCRLTTPDEYVFGYGMDIDHHWRNTDSIYIYQPSEQD